MSPSQIAARWHLKQAMNRYRFMNDAEDAKTVAIAKLFEERTGVFLENR